MRSLMLRNLPKKFLSPAQSGVPCCAVFSALIAANLVSAASAWSSLLFFSLVDKLSVHIVLSVARGVLGLASMTKAVCCFCLSSYLNPTYPLISEYIVWSLAILVPSPATYLWPLCKSIKVPFCTISPPNFRTPNLLPSLSLPFLDDPPAFLVASRDGWYQMRLADSDRAEIFVLNDRPQQLILFSWESSREKVATTSICRNGE